MEQGRRGLPVLPVRISAGFQERLLTYPVGSSSVRSGWRRQLWWVPQKYVREQWSRKETDLPGGFDNSFSPGSVRLSIMTPQELRSVDTNWKCSELMFLQHSPEQPEMVIVRTPSGFPTAKRPAITIWLRPRPATCRRRSHVDRSR